MKLPIKRKLSKKEQEVLSSLIDEKSKLEYTKNEIKNQLNPILLRLEIIRLKIDEIELE